MKKLLGILAPLALFAGMASASTDYAFSTTGSYTGSGTLDTSATGNSCSTTNLCVDFSAGTDGEDPLVLQFVYTPFSDPTGSATQVDYFGTVQIFCVDTVSGSTSDSNCITTTAFSGDLTITVNQTAPDSENNTFVDTLAGTASTGGTVDFGTSTFTLDGGVLTYSLQQPAQYLIGAIDSSATSLQGIVTDNTTPEPATFGMMGAALLGLGFIARKRKA